jgi:hypothetical protein
MGCGESAQAEVAETGMMEAPCLMVGAESVREAEEEHEGQ